MGLLSAGVVMVLAYALRRQASTFGARLMLLGPGVVLIGGALVGLGLPTGGLGKWLVVGTSAAIGGAIVVGALLAGIAHRRS